jgi:hypothetical protein
VVALHRGIIDLLVLNDLLDRVSDLRRVLEAFDYIQVVEGLLEVLLFGEISG